MSSPIPRDPAASSCIRPSPLEFPPIFLDPPRSVHLAVESHARFYKYPQAEDKRREQPATIATACGDSGETTDRLGVLEIKTHMPLFERRPAYPPRYPLCGSSSSTASTLGVVNQGWIERLHPPPPPRQQGKIHALIYSTPSPRLHKGYPVVSSAGCSVDFETASLSALSLLPTPIRTRQAKIGDPSTSPSSPQPS
jgi:hypothetical protein